MSFSIQDLLYIDPASGSLVLQALLAGMLGLLWRVSRIFTWRKKTDSLQAEASHESAHALTQESGKGDA
ncbi:MAG TPA: hypothetical protein VFB38_10940 [Chthonomonadaceae bacterium]|nr:hypothetical protein [Chthonomonadaceae bacterium]